MRLLVGSVAALFLASGCSAGEPTVSATETVILDSDTVVQSVLGDAWSQLGAEDKEAVCLLFRYDEDMAWEAFSSGGDAEISRRQFERFFSGECWY